MKDDTPPGSHRVYNSTAGLNKEPVLIEPEVTIGAGAQLPHAPERGFSNAILTSSGPSNGFSTLKAQSNQNPFAA